MKKNIPPVYLVGGATAFSLLGDQTLYAVLPTYYAELGLLPWHVGLLLSANRFVRIFINHWAERFCQLYAPRLLFLLALVGGAALTAVYAVVTSFVFLLVARVLWGICWTFIRQIGLTTVAESSQPEQVGRSMGLYSGLSRLGSLAGNFLGALGHDILGFSGVLLLFSSLSLLAAPLGPLSRRGVPDKSGQENTGKTQSKAGSRLLLGGFSVGFVGQGAIMSTLGLVMAEALGAGVEIAGVFVGVATLTGALMATRWVADIGAPVMGALSDRWGRRKGAMVFLSAGSLALLLAAFNEGLEMRALCVVLFFVCATGAHVSLVAEVGARGSRAVASYVTAADLGACTGPIVAWMMPQWELPTMWIFVVGALCYGVTAVVNGWRLD
ncbi:MAG: MFS transporter [Candidatus Latescibacterota bacterium]